MELMQSSPNLSNNPSLAHEDTGMVDQLETVKLTDLAHCPAKLIGCRHPSKCLAGWPSAPGQAHAGSGIFSSRHKERQMRPTLFEEDSTEKVCVTTHSHTCLSPEHVASDTGPKRMPPTF